MASKRSKKTKLPRTFNVQIQINIPEPVVIPVPSKELSSVSMVEFVITIKNNTSLLLPFSLHKCLIPELLSKMGKELNQKKH